MTEWFRPAAQRRIIRAASAIPGGSGEKRHFPAAQRNGDNGAPRMWATISSLRWDPACHPRLHSDGKQHVMLPCACAGEVRAYHLARVEHSAQKGSPEASFESTLPRCFPSAADTYCAVCKLSN